MRFWPRRREPWPGGRDLKAAITAALNTAIAGDTARLAGPIGKIAGRWGPAGVHAAVCGWSAISLEAIGGGPAHRTPGGFWAIEVENRATGDLVSIDQTPLPPATRDAFRLIACLGNHDHDTIAAMIADAWERDSCAELMVSAVVLAATAVQAHADGAAGSPGGP